MIRSIIGFHPDNDGDWVAELSCYHNQHLRHRPPFQLRPWVLDPDERAGRIGAPIDCPLCDRAELPDGLVVTNRAGPWDSHSLPGGLRSAHRTPRGRWGRLRVRRGSVGFQFDPDATPPGPVVHLETGSLQPIPPDRPHRVVVSDEATLELELMGPD